MNLNISYNWLKSYVKTNLTPQEFAKRLSLSGPSIDHITEIKPNFEKVVVGQILSIDRHPDADKLHVCKVDVAEKEPLQIVCGAPNIEVGQKVPVVLVGGKVGDFEIKAAKLRCVESFGMMCSQKELGLGEDHTGIFILPAYVKAGQPLEKVMPIEDTILDIEVTSNRPDAMSVVGLAREASAILGEKLLYQKPNPNLKIKGKEHHLKVKVSEDKLCLRYSAIVMTDVKVEASPLWMQQRLLASGLRPINNLVDITNYILLEFGQPMHVFDFNKLSGSEINVRLAKPGEKIIALDGKEYELSADNLIIADKTDPVAVAGVMGGELSAASGDTNTIVFECANFNPVSVRRTSRALNLRSESSALYEKGLSPENCTAAMLRAIELAEELANAKVACELIDEQSYKYKAKEITLDLDRVNCVLGVKIKPAEIKKNLEALGFEVVSTKTQKDEFIVTVPWWRDNDIEGQHDLVEEIARLHGYYNLSSKLMAGELPLTPTSPEFALEDQTKDILAGFGLTEIFTYSFTSEKIITDSRLAIADHILIANPLSADFAYMRTSLIPGALQIISENQGFYSQVKLFDLSKVYLPAGENDLPEEKSVLLIISSAKDGQTALAEVKGIFEAMLSRLNIKAGYEQNSEASGAFGQPNARILLSKQGIGNIGIANGLVLQAFGIKNSVAFVEVDFSGLSQEAKAVPAYTPISKFPAIELDLSMEIDNVVTFAEVANVVSDIGAPLVENVDFLSVYQGENLPEGKKAMAIRIVYRDLNKTLELAEAQAAHDKVVAELKKSYNISVR